MPPRVYRGVALAAFIFLLIQLGALALVPTFHEQGYQAVENPSDPANSLVYLGAILVATALMLAAFRFDLDWAVRAVIVFTSGLLAWYVFAAVVPAVVTVGGADGVAVLPIALAAAVALALLAYPEWYVIDAAGVVMGAGAAGLFGISFGLLPAVVLLAALAVYDAISVYGTEHMLDLAEGVMDLRIPVVLVVPLTFSYSLLDADPVGEAGLSDGDSSETTTRHGADGAGGGPEPPAGRPEGDGGDSPDSDPSDSDLPDSDPSDRRDVFFIGLGDAVLPTVMTASAAFFSPAASLGVPWVPALNLPALAAMIGTFAGLGVLLRAVLEGRPHAGLPLLNGGAIGGYLVGSVLAGVPLATALGL